MNQVLTIHKPLGFTPLQTLDKLRKERPELAGEKLSYAGRLDPMAEGVLVVLVGEANKEREKYLGLDKEYEFEMVLGISTDSYDVLGLVKEVNPEVNVSKKDLQIAMNRYIGKVSLPYPAYSSRTVGGKPLWWWARQGRVGEIEVPMNEFEVYELKLLEFGTIDSNELLRNVKSKVAMVRGDFHQEAIVASWDQHIKNTPRALQLITCLMKCGTGGYVRSVAHDIGAQLQLPSVCTAIKRLKVGNLH